jgi:lysophospholipase L1-like esterase
MENLTLEQLSYIIQFRHPEKFFGDLPGMNDALIANLYGIQYATYEGIKAHFVEYARKAAGELLADADFAARVDRLPFQPGQRVVCLGDSITDDYQSWAEILRHTLAIRRPDDAITVINAGVSGDTTAQMLSRFLAVVQQEPAWVICMAGTNDARRHGLQPAKILVSLDETAQNLAALRHFAATQTAARWVWMTPASVLEEQIVNDWFIGSLQVSWRNADLRAIGDRVRAMPDPVVDLQAAFGIPPKPEYLLPDGLHPSLAGQQVMLRALVERLTD